MQPNAFHPAEEIVYCRSSLTEPKLGKNAMYGEIEKWRMKIDDIDDELLRLLNERAKVVAKLGVIKRSRGIPVRDPVREDRVLMRVRERNCGPLDEAAALRIFQSIIGESCRTQFSAAEIETLCGQRKSTLEMTKNISTVTPRIR